MATLLDLALKVTLLLIVSGAIVGLMRQASAASRHVALTAALGAAVLLPAARWLLPALPVFVLTAESTPAAVSSAPPIEASAPITATVFSSTPNTVGPVDQQVANILLPEPVRASVPAWSWSRVIGILWLLGTATVLVRMTVAAIRIRKLARDARPIDDARLITRLLDIKAQFGVARPITLVVSAHEWMPLTWALMRPTILLPSSAVAWTQTRLDAVLLHEMAHIARWDAAWHGIARMAVALFWFNPLVWIAARRARLERERACDDAVLARGLRATDYASDLLVLAQTLMLPPRAAGSALAMARRSQLEQRVGALLDTRVSRRRASRVSRLLALALTVLMLPMSAAKLAARPLAALDPSVVSNGARGLQTPGRDDVREPAFPVLAAPQSEPVAGPATRRPPSRASVMNGAPTSITEALPKVDAPPNAEALADVEPQQPSTPPLNQPAKWKLERDAMFRLVLEQARNFVKDGRTKIEIGTMALIDMKPLEDTLAFVERAAAAAVNNGCPGHDPFISMGGGTCVNGGWRPAATSIVAINQPTDTDIANVKTRFTEAMRNLDFVEVRWDNGLATTAEVAAALRTAVVVLTGDMGHVPTPGTQAASMFTAANFPGSTTSHRTNAQALYELLTSRADPVTVTAGQPPVQIRFVSRSGTNTLSDAELLELLKDVASIKGDVDRANVLLALSVQYAFTPEMVTLYVAAAKGITSSSQQIRVFAQPIRVK